MAYLIEMIERDVLKITLSANDVVVTPVKIVHDSYVEEAADISVSPSVTPVSNVYTLTGAPADEFEITFNEDGVYKLSITEGDGSYIHYVYIMNEVDDYFIDTIPNLIVPNPLGDHLLDPDHRTYYDFNVVSMLTIGFFFETNANVFLDYSDISAGMLYKDQIYQCRSIGSGTYNWQDALGDDILMDMSGHIVTSNTALILNAYYKCIKTATPVNYGGTTATELSLYTDTFYQWLLQTVESLYRFNKYVNDCIDTNV